MTAVMEGEKRPEVRPLLLKSSDGQVFEVDKAVASQSPILKFVMEDTTPQDFIPVINVSGHTLAVVIQYCKYHEENDNITPFDTIDAWDASFVNYNKEIAGNLMRAADYLHLEHLLQRIGDAILVMIIDGGNPLEVLGRELGIAEVLRKLHRIM